jgi:hypothetical protein
MTFILELHAQTQLYTLYLLISKKKSIIKEYFEVCEHFGITDVLK